MWVKFPSKNELLILGAFFIVAMFLGAFKLNGDSFWGYPITERVMGLNYYQSDDLLVNSGSGNFIFYKLLAYFPFFRDNFVIRDFVLSLPLTILIILAWYNVFSLLTNKKRVVMMAMFFLLFADEKLYLHGYPIPLFTLTSIGSIYFIQVFAFCFFLKERYLLSFGLLALSSYFHPASAFVILSVLGTIFGVKMVREKHPRNLLKAFLVTLILIFPNLILLRQNIGGAIDVEKFFYITDGLRQVASQYVDQYASRSYLYTFAAIFLVMLNAKKKFFEIRQESVIVWFIAISLIGSIVSTINLYYFHNISILFTLYIARVFFIIEPLLVFYVTIYAYSLLCNRGLATKVLSILMFLSLVVFSSFLGGIIIAIGALFYWRSSQKIRTSVAEIEIFSVKHKIVIVLTLFVAASVFGYLRGNKISKVYKLLRGENTFNFSFSVKDNYQYKRTNPHYSDLLDWGKQYQGKMFIIPQEGDDIFDSFRYLTKNSEYISTDDMGQLAYSPKEYFEAYDRLLSLGFKIVGDGKFDLSDYYRMNVDEFKFTNADFVIFDKEQSGYRSKNGHPAVYENTKYVVYSLK